MFYIINKDTREVIRTSLTPFNIDESVQPPLPAVQLKKVENMVKPALNEATQKHELTFIDNDAAGTRTFSYIVVPKTQEDIAADAQAAADSAERAQIKATYMAMKNGTGTNLERITRLERAVTYMAKALG